MSDDVSRLPVTACEGASLDDNHWSGVAAGEPFELHLKFDGTLYATDTFPVRMLRSTDGLEVVCREPLHSRFTTKAGGRSKYHVEKWCRTHFKPPLKSAKRVKQVALAFTPLPKSRATFLQLEEDRRPMAMYERVFLLPRREPIFLVISSF